MIGWLAATIVGSISDPRSGSPASGRVRGGLVPRGGICYADRDCSLDR
jgi:hypothetical protein